MDNDPAAVWPRMALAFVYQNTNQPDLAIDTVRTGLLSRPDWEAGYGFLAELLVRSSKPSGKDEARQWLQAGLAKLPESVSLRGALATLEIDAGRPAVAQKILEPLAQKFDQLGGGSGSPEKLDKLRPYLQPIRLYSLALYNQGKAEDAMTWGLKVWNLDPTDVANANNLAWILATAFGRLDKADEIIKQCLRVVPNHPQVLDTAGWVAFLMKRYEEAADDFRASMKYGDNAQAHYHMGCLLEGTDHAEEARVEFKKALDMGLSEKDRDDAKIRLDKLPK
jgi:tetratricopeptide (TPR) repeat protein